jgi:hypothetical protein
VEATAGGGVKGFGYRTALDALGRGEVAAIAVRPPYVMLVTFAPDDISMGFLKHEDGQFRAGAALTFVQEAHDALLEEIS